MTTLSGEYAPSPAEWVRDQVAEYEASGGQRANTFLDTGLPIIVMTTRGAKSGKVRKNPLMRVEHDGTYVLVASKGGRPENPEWYHNLVAHPREVVLQDGPEARVRPCPASLCTAPTSSRSTGRYPTGAAGARTTSSVRST